MCNLWPVLETSPNENWNLVPFRLWKFFKYYRLSESFLGVFTDNLLSAVFSQSFLFNSSLAIVSRTALCGMPDRLRLYYKSRLVAVSKITWLPSCLGSLTYPPTYFCIFADSGRVRENGMKIYTQYTLKFDSSFQLGVMPMDPRCDAQAYLLHLLLVCLFIYYCLNIYPAKQT